MLFTVEWSFLEHVNIIGFAFRQTKNWQTYIKSLLLFILHRKCLTIYDCKEYKDAAIKVDLIIAVDPIIPGVSWTLS